MKKEKISYLATTLVVLGIIFASDQVIGYTFIGSGVILSIFSLIISNRKKSEEI